MNIVEKVENGPVLLCPSIYGDDRGYFYESFNDKFFRENVCDTAFVQDNQSRSSYGVVRGMHFQKGIYAQAKLVRVVKGAVLDVVVDIRQDSPFFGKYYEYLLTEDNHYQLFVPRGFAHGFICLKDDTIFQYKCDNLYCKEAEGSFNYNSFGFNWEKYVPKDKIIASEKDRNAEPFEGGKYLNTVEISREKLQQLISDRTPSLGYMSKVTVDYSSRFQFPENYYAEIRAEDGSGAFHVRLLGLTAPVYDPAAFIASPRISVERVDNGSIMTLSPDFHEVIKFYEKLR